MAFNPECPIDDILTPLVNEYLECMDDLGASYCTELLDNASAACGTNEVLSSDGDCVAEGAAPLGQTLVNGQY